MKQNQIEKNIYNLYKSEPKCLNKENIKKLILHYWSRYDDVSFPMSAQSFLAATNPESIVRARRKVREELGINDVETDLAEKEYREYYADKGL